MSKEILNGKSQRLKILLKSDGILTDSLSSKMDIEKYAGLSKNKIDVAYLAASDDYKKIIDKRLLNGVRKKYNLPEKFVLYVGDVTWNKNLPRLISAITKS